MGGYCEDFGLSPREVGVTGGFGAEEERSPTWALTVLASPPTAHSLDRKWARCLKMDLMTISAQPEDFVTVGIHGEVGMASWPDEQSPACYASHRGQENAWGL